MPTYTVRMMLGDFVAGLSLASFQIPLALSYATSVAHVPALCGLYALAVPPIFYAIFGSVPQMIVGPESAISLIIGQAVEPLLAHHSGKYDPVDLVSVLTIIGGFYLLGAGLCRFGYLDNVLSRSLLRGFISAVGLVMIINSSFDAFGIYVINEEAPRHFHSPVAKIFYLLSHLNSDDIHRPTTWISIIAFTVLMIVGRYKKKLISKVHQNWVFLPEILIVVVVSTLLSSFFDWKSLGVEIVGKIDTKGFTYKMPFTPEYVPLYKQLMSSGFLAATLGFFESTTASKSLGSTYDLPISSNRELVALGFINIFGGIIGALPSFGGYGRSKINALSGGQTTLSGFFMGVITLLTIFCLLKYIYYLPISILSVITAIVGIKLLDETPSDLHFHITTRGYRELVTFCITLLATLFYSMEAGITLGVGYSIILVIKNSAKSRIQILGRLPNTNIFFNADEPLPKEYGEVLEEIEGCLIVKVVEPLTFSNAADLKLRLLRLERYGSSKVHPSAPRLRDESMNNHVLFDLNGMSFLDSSAAQIFHEILVGYTKKNINFYLIRVPTKHRVRKTLEASGIYELGGKKYYSSIEEVMHLIDSRESVQPSNRFNDELV
jgi:high affinity sulfate transporter 1